MRCLLAMGLVLGVSLSSAAAEEAKSILERAIQAHGGAAAIEARAKALGTNPNLVTLVQAERWNGVLPTTMVPGSAVPFVSVK